MSFNERRRYVKIVTPQDLNRERELIGGLQNAIERGQGIESAKQSFLNAGYQLQEIENAIGNINMSANQQTQQTAPQTATTVTAAPTQPAKGTQPISTTSATASTGKKKLSKKFLIFLICISVGILIIAAVLGIYWDRLFG